MVKRPSSRLSYQLLVTFLAEKQRLSPAKNFNSPSVYDEKKSLWRSALLTETSLNFPLENSDLNHVIFKQHPYDYKLSTGLDLDFSVNYTAIRLYSSGALLCVNEQRRRISEPPLWC